MTNPTRLHRQSNWENKSLCKGTIEKQLKTMSFESEQPKLLFVPKLKSNSHKHANYGSTSHPASITRPARKHWHMIRRFCVTFFPYSVLNLKWSVDSNIQKRAGKTHVYRYKFPVTRETIFPVAACMGTCLMRTLQEASSGFTSKYDWLMILFCKTNSFVAGNLCGRLFLSC